MILFLCAFVMPAITITAPKDGVQATIRGIFATSSSLIGAYILQYNGPMVALWLSFAIIIARATFLPFGNSVVMCDSC